MARLIESVDSDTIRRNLEQVRERIAACGRRPDEVEVLVAVKYLRSEMLPALAAAGVAVVGENRAQDLLAKQDDHPGAFTWDFIGQLQSRKVKVLLGRVRLIHSLASDSALEQLRRHEPGGTEFLVEVNVAGEAGKGGVGIDDLPGFLERCPVPVVGLMTMPPQAASPEESRPYFTRLRELAEHHGLRRLSMGTTQDYVVAVQEGATIVRFGDRDPAGRKPATGPLSVIIRAGKRPPGAKHPHDHGLPRHLAPHSRLLRAGRRRGL